MCLVSGGCRVCARKILVRAYVVYMVGRFGCAGKSFGVSWAVDYSRRSTI